MVLCLRSMEYKSIFENDGSNRKSLKEGMRINSDIFWAGKDFNTPLSIFDFIKEANLFMKIAEQWKRDGVLEISARKGEYIPMWK